MHEKHTSFRWRVAQYQALARQGTKTPNGPNFSGLPIPKMPKYWVQKLDSLDLIGGWKSHHQYFGILRCKSYQKVYLNRTKKFVSSQGLRLQFGFRPQSSLAILMSYMMMHKVKVWNWNKDLFNVNLEFSTCSANSPCSPPPTLVAAKAADIMKQIAIQTNPIVLESRNRVVPDSQSPGVLEFLVRYIEELMFLIILHN